MTRLVFKSNLTPTFSLTCSLFKSTQVKLDPTTLESAFTCAYEQGMMVNVFIESLKIGWEPQSTYSIVVNSGFFTDQVGNNSPTQTISYTTGTGAVVIGDYLGFNTGDTSNNTFFGFYFDRYISKGSSNTAVVGLYYNNNGVGELLHTWTNSQATFYPSTDQNAFDITIAGYLKPNTNYFFTIDKNFIKDSDNLGNSAIGGLTFTTVGEPQFKDLNINLQSTAYLLVTNYNIIGPEDRLLVINGFATSYIEDTLSPVINFPTITDPFYNGSGLYTLTITPSDTTAYQSIGPINVNGSYNYNTSTHILTLHDTKINVNNMLGALGIMPSVDFEGYYTLTYNLTSPINGSISKTQQVNRGTPYDTQVTGIPTTVNYIENQTSNGFQTIQITDFDTSTGTTWTVRLNTQFGQFGSTSVGLTNNWTVTGSKSYVNSELASVYFYPPGQTYDNTTVTYYQSKSDRTGYQIQQNIAVTGTPGTTKTTYYLYTVTNAPNGSYTFTPSPAQAQYGSIVVTLIGGGGSSSSEPQAGAPFNSSHFGYGGGGGGGVYTQQVFLSPQTYFITVGGAGKSITNGYGGTSGFSGLTASGGSPGYLKLMGYGYGNNPLYGYAGGASGGGATGGNPYVINESTYGLSAGGAGASSSLNGSNAGQFGAPNTSGLSDTRFTPSQNIGAGGAGEPQVGTYNLGTYNIVNSTNPYYGCGGGFVDPIGREGNPILILGVSVANTTGQFNYTSCIVPLQVGQSITIAGTWSGTGSITNPAYSSPFVGYLISAVGTNYFRLTTLTGQSLTTIPGTINGVTFSFNGSYNLIYTEGGAGAVLIEVTL
jgi:hypothetical protein